MVKKKNEKEEVQPVIPAEKKDKSVISSEDVEEVVSGDEKALNEQMERIKTLTKEQQLEAIEAEKRKKEELEKQKQQEQLKAQQKAIEDEKIRVQKQQEAALLAQQQAEAERKKKEAEEQQRKQQELLKQQQEANQKEQQERLQKQEAEKKRLEQQKIINQQAMSATTTNHNIHVNAGNAQNSTQNVTETSTDTPDSKGGPSTFKRVMAAILFISLMVMIYFLPEITSYINDIKNKNNQEKITSGVLECNLKKTSKKLDIDIETLFYFANNELYKMSYTTVHTGDKTEDEEELKGLYDNCILLKQEAGELEGVTISCSLNNGIHSNKQILDYEKLDVAEVSSAYTEAGGIYPAEFKKSENIDKIESEMTSNGYTCNRK